jgi:hypothetical protein
MSSFPLKPIPHRALHCYSTHYSLPEAVEAVAEVVEVVVAVGFVASLPSSLATGDASEDLSAGFLLLLGDGSLYHGI